MTRGFESPTFFFGDFMTLTEAVISERPFKRRSESSWYVVIGEEIVMQSNSTNRRYTRHISKEEDLAANDFEIQKFSIPKWLEDKMWKGVEI
jgi:hypothetical protein